MEPEDECELERICITTFGKPMRNNSWDPKRSVGIFFRTSQNNLHTLCMGTFWNYLHENERWVENNQLGIGMCVILRKGKIFDRAMEFKDQLNKGVVRRNYVLFISILLVGSVQSPRLLCTQSLVLTSTCVLPRYVSTNNYIFRFVDHYLIYVHYYCKNPKRCTWQVPMSGPRLKFSPEKRQQNKNRRHSRLRTHLANTLFCEVCLFFPKRIVYFISN